MTNQLLLMIMCFFCLAFSGLAFKNILHPHFVFTAIWIYLLPLGAILNPETPFYVSSLGGDGDLIGAHSTIVALLLTLYLVTFAMAARNGVLNRMQLSRELKSSLAAGGIVACVGSFLLATQVVNQLVACEWSVERWVTYSLGPRFGRPWKGATVGGSDFFMTFLNSLFPYCGLALTYSVFALRGWGRMLASSAWLLSIAIMFCDGSRTSACLGYRLLWRAVLCEHKRDDPACWRRGDDCGIYCVNGADAQLPAERAYGFS